MGNSDTKLQEQDHRKFMEKYTDKGKVKDPLYGEGRILQEKQTKIEIFIKEYTANDEENFRQSLKRFEDRTRLRNSNLIEIKGFTCNTEIQFCSTIFKSYLLFEYCTNSLELEITNRRGDIPKYFTNEELWRMIEEYVCGLSFLQENKIHHGDIKPSTLFINKGGIHKIAEQTLLNPNSSYVQILSNSQREHKNIYISPALLKSLEINSFRPKHSIYKSDVFSLGVSLLHASLLESCDDIYNFTKFVIVDDALEEKIEKMKLTYNNDLIDIILQMVVVDEKNRPDFIALKTFIENKKKNIRLDSPIKVSYQINQNQTENSGEKILTFKKEDSNYASPLFEPKETNYRVIVDPMPVTYQYKDPVPVPIQSYSYNDPYVSFQPTQKEETLKKSNYIESEPLTFQPQYRAEEYNQKHYSVDPEPGYQIYKTEFVKRSNYVEPEPIKEEIKPQTQNQAQIQSYSGDYYINYDDINSLLKKYGIEPLQPMTSFSTKDNTITGSNLQAEPKVISYQSHIYSDNKKDNFEFSDQKNSMNSFQPVVIEEKPVYYQEKPAEFNNYSELLRKYDDPKEGVKKSYRPNDISYDPNPLQYVNNNQYTYSYEVNQYPISPPQIEKPYSKVTDYNTYSTEYNKPLNQFQFSETKEKEKKSREFSSYSSKQKEIIIENYQNGARYEGEKVNGLREGHGKFYYADGGVYEGEWLQNRMNGKGTLYYMSGKVAYEGNWVEDKFEGQGTFYSDSPMNLEETFDYRDFDMVDDFVVRYEGGFHEDDKDGYGILFLTNGEKFVGYFKADKLEGRGMFYKRSGELVSGVWRDNKLESID